jgi:hypothetical protein
MLTLIIYDIQIDSESIVHIRGVATFVNKFSRDLNLWAHFLFFRVAIVSAKINKTFKRY